MPRRPTPPSNVCRIDIVNEYDKIIGQAEIERAHSKGLLHRAVHAFIVDPAGRLFLRQRSVRKKRYPGYWSTSVGAHVQAGQKYDEAVSAAVKETLGIECTLRMIGKDRIHDDVENEISATFVGYSDGPLRLNPEQIERGEFIKVDEIKKLIAQGNVTPHLAQALKLYLASI